MGEFSNRHTMQGQCLKINYICIILGIYNCKINKNISNDIKKLKILRNGFTKTNSAILLD